MAGFGTAPFGTGPFGVGTPVEWRAPPTNPPANANFVNYRTRDYEADEEGELKRMPVMRQAVLMLLSTVRGSAATLPDIGLELPAKIDAQFRQNVDQAVRLALEPLAGRIRVDDVNPVVVGTGRADITVSYTDLTTGNSDTVTI